MEIKDTVSLTASEDYGAQLTGEYLQAVIRLDRLKKEVVKYGADVPEDYPLMNKQVKILEQYVKTLKKRFNIRVGNI